MNWNKFIEKDERTIEEMQKPSRMVKPHVSPRKIYRWRR